MQVANPLQNDLKSSLDLGGEGMLAWLKPAFDLLPIGGYEAAHDTGRWWDAMLRLEHATGFKIPAHVGAAMLANLQRLTDNPDRLLITETRDKNTRNINPHNLRETIIAYAALIRYRNSDWARKAGHHFIQTIDRCFLPDGHFDATQLSLWGKAPLSGDPFVAEKENADGWFDATTSTGRCLEGVIWYYEATGDESALQLAKRLAEHHLPMIADAHGEARLEFFADDHIGHNHSYLGTLRGLLLFGFLTGQRRYIDAISNIYRHSIWQRNIDDSCFTIHDLGKLRGPDLRGNKGCESASAGDIAQLALWLALRDGQTDLLDDIERIIRSHLFPIQIAREEIGTRLPNGWVLMPEAIGGWGCTERGMKSSTHDVLAAVVHSLCDVYENTVITKDGQARLNWHFDYGNDLLHVTREIDPEPRVQIRLKKPGVLLVRPPNLGSSFSAKIDGTPAKLERENVYFKFAARESIELTYTLPQRTTLERMADGTCFQFDWLGHDLLDLETLPR